MPRTHREGLKPEPRSTEIQRGQNWKHRWIERTVTIGFPGTTVGVWYVTSEGRENYRITSDTLYRDYRLVT